MSTETPIYKFIKSQTGDNIGKTIGEDLPANWDKVEAQLNNLDAEPIVATLNPVSGYVITSDRILKKDGWVECFFKLDKADTTDFATGKTIIALTDIIPVGYRYNKWLDIIIHGATNNDTTSTIFGAGNFKMDTGNLQFNISTACKTLVIYIVTYVGGGTI